MKLQTAIDIATEAHRDQVARDGTPFIDHVVRVMQAAVDEDQRIVAVLHDVVERSHWTIESLKQVGLRPDLAEAVDLLTRRPGDSHADLVKRVAGNKLARAVKILDLKDKANIGRGRENTDEHSRRLAQYLDALLILRA